MSKCCKKCSCSKPKSITFEVVEQGQTPDYDSQELIVMPVQLGAGQWPDALTDLDNRTDGRIGLRIEHEDFVGVLDEHLLIDLNEMRLSADLPRFLLLIEVGRAKPVASMQLCCSFGMAACLAVTLGVNRISIFLDGCTIKDPSEAGSILRCRFSREAEMGENSKLNLVRVMARTNESAGIKKGLDSTNQACAYCVLPEAE